MQRKASNSTVPFMVEGIKQTNLKAHLNDMANEDSSFCDSGLFSACSCSAAGLSDSFFLTRKAPFLLTLFSMSSALSLLRLSWYQLQQEVNHFALLMSQ